MSVSSIWAGIAKKRWKYAGLGALLSFIGPMGEWLIVHNLFGDVDERLFITLIYIEVFCLIVFGSFGFVLGVYTERLEGLAFRDQLTGLYGRHYLFEALSELLEQNNRYQKNFSLIMLDLDHFKQVNDVHGHTVGDKTLKAVATCIHSEVRKADIAARYGGEEFMIVCPSTSVEDCHDLAERIRIAISGLGANSLGYPGPQTISGGVVGLTAAEEKVTLRELVNRADKALYDAKRSGRNRIIVCPARALSIPAS
ncbi:MAG: hypothetical protein CMF25_05035 [Kangiellaceae bacterium]|jgi:diguanylate cyclase (GGDEF)-like protein|nr:hypothetical protein [Kangiellaceae bacterium]|tara:strand:+ start:13684 stop:14445 length:762 start_codon:yes stop_codon:yes gene_type:complete